MNPEEILFKTNSQKREKLTVWRLFNSPFIYDLSAGLWKYFAVGIPLNLLGGETIGDIDLLICRPTLSHQTYEVDFEKLEYRVFEIKVSTTDINGIPKSLKLGKMNKIKSQVNKLKKFGCPLIYYFEIFLFETGFSDSNFSPTKEMIKSIKTKEEFFATNQHGFLISALEFVKNFPEKHACKWRPIINVSMPEKQDSKKAFHNLSNCLEKFYNENLNILKQNSFNGIPVISYCYSCRQLIVPKTTLECSKCNTTLLTD